MVTSSIAEFTIYNFSLIDIRLSICRLGPLTKLRNFSLNLIFVFHDVKKNCSTVIAVFCYVWKNVILNLKIHITLHKLIISPFLHENMSFDLERTWQTFILSSQVAKVFKIFFMRVALIDVGDQLFLIY